MAAKKRTGAAPPFERVDVAEAFAAIPEPARTQLMELRSLIIDTAKKTPGVGPLDEVLRWGEPSYLTAATKSGTTIRIHWKARQPDRCAMYVHCQTSLVEQYRLRHSDSLEFEGSRAVLFDVHKPLPVAALRDCIELALTYHRT